MYDVCASVKNIILAGDFNAVTKARDRIGSKVQKLKKYETYWNNFIKNLNLAYYDLEDQIKILEDIPEEKFSFRYKEGKWSIAELLQHICDSETVFAYRALSFSRNDKTNLPGFDENDWAKNGACCCFNGSFCFNTWNCLNGYV